MVDRQYRLREEHDVKRVRGRGRSVAQGALVLRYMPNSRESNRYTVIAGKKCGNAVHRNRLKRVVREALRGFHPHLRTGFDVAIVCRGGVEEMPDLTAAQKTLRMILQRTELVQPGHTLPEPGTPVTTSWKPSRHAERSEASPGEAGPNPHSHAERSEADTPQSRYAERSEASPGEAGPITHNEGGPNPTTSTETTKDSPTP